MPISDNGDNSNGRKEGNYTAEMPVLEHLRELRSCLVAAGIGVALMSVATIAAADEIFIWLVRPLLESFPGAELIGTSPAEAFIAKLKVALAAGVVISIPHTFYQLWRFIAPGLLERERHFVIPFVASASGFFLIGILFCFHFVLPVAFNYFAGEYSSVGAKPAIRIDDYLSFVLMMMLVFGFSFQLPLVSYLLARMRVLTYHWLTRNFRYTVVIIFVIAALLTPPDVVSQLLLALPLLVLYGLSVVVVKRVEAARAASLARTE